MQVLVRMCFRRPGGARVGYIDSMHHLSMNAQRPRLFEGRGRWLNTSQGEAQVGLIMLAARRLRAFAVAASTDTSRCFGRTDLRLDAVAFAARCDGMVRRVLHAVTLLVSSRVGQRCRRLLIERRRSLPGRGSCV
jgi:hypothetical protein